MNNGPVVAPLLPPPASSFDAQGRFVGSSAFQATAALASEEPSSEAPEPSNVERMLSEQLAYRVRHMRLDDSRESSASTSAAASASYSSSYSPSYERPYYDEQRRGRGYQHWGPRPSRGGRGRGGYYQRH